MKSQGIDLFLSRFPAFDREVAAYGPAWLRSIRREAIARFEALGFPDSRQEAWRFTDVKPIARTAFHLVTEPASNGWDRAAVERLAFPGVEGERIVFLDGHYSPELSHHCPVPGAVRIQSLAAALKEDPEPLRPFLARHAKVEENPFVALNTAYMRDGAYIRIPRGEQIRQAIHLLFLTTAARRAVVTHPRILIVAEEGSRATVVESFAGPGDQPYFTNAVTEIVVQGNAELDHCKLQREGRGAFHIATIQAYQERDSKVLSHSISLGARLARNDLNFVLDGEGSECTLNGLYMTTNRQHVDHHTLIDHARPNSTSLECYKGVLDGESRGVFHGKIVVRKDAQKTNARQSNKNLLLSEGATVHTQPQLEIYADDVKCAHGATIGQLDEDSLYYLRTRGLGPAEARTLLTYGFVRDITERIRIEPIRAKLETLVLARLRGAGRKREGR